jgi:cytochrome c-type biogenesis protein CcmH/NrfG
MKNNRFRSDGLEFFGEFSEAACSYPRVLTQRRVEVEAALGGYCDVVGLLAFLWGSFFGCCFLEHWARLRVGDSLVLFIIFCGCMSVTMPFMVLVEASLVHLSTVKPILVTNQAPHVPFWFLLSYIAKNSRCFSGENVPGYSYVKDSQGSVCGLLLSNHDYWFEDSAFMCGCNNFEAMALLDGNLSPKMKNELENHKYRKVSNNADLGGWYIMFGSAKAPCELTAGSLWAADAHYKRAEELFGENQIDAAIKEYKQAIAMQPNHARAYMGLGDCYYVKKDYDSAITYFEKSLSIKPEAFTYRYLGDAFLNKGELDRAIDAYQKSVDANPNYAPARHALELAQLKKRQRNPWQNESAKKPSLDALQDEFLVYFRRFGLELGLGSGYDSKNVVQAMQQAMAALMMKYGVFEEPEFNAILDGAMEKIRH